MGHAVALMHGRSSELDRRAGEVLEEPDSLAEE
jgi:hypothetical protein